MIQTEEEKRPEINTIDEDLDLLQRSIQEIHPNKAVVNSEDFVLQIERARHSIAEDPTPVNIWAKLQQIFKYLGDSHTGIEGYQKLGLKRAPVRFTFFDDGLAVTQVQEGQEKFLGARVLSINNVPIETILENIEPYLVYENGPNLRQKQANLNTEELLTVAGVLNNGSSVKLQVETRGGTKDEFAQKLSDVSKKDRMVAKWSEDHDAHPLSQGENQLKRYWFEFIAEQQTIYFQYNSCKEDPNETTEDFIERLWTQLEKKQAQKLIIDLRYNGGGNSRLLEPFYEKIKEREERLKIIVLIGQKTFSSAVLHAIKLSFEHNATLMGQETAGNPGARYGDLKKVNLSGLGLYLFVSSKKFDFSDFFDGKSNTLHPDIVITRTIKEYRANRDKTLERALAHNVV